MLINKQSAPLLKIKELKESGEFEGYASTFGGEPDSHGDVVVAGAFEESLITHKAAGTMPKMFWQHDSSAPLGRWLEIKEDETGLLVSGKLNMGVQKAREAYALLAENDIDGLSIGYHIKEKTEDSKVWYLEKLDLMEISIVSIGANSLATISSVKASRELQNIIEKLKSGDQLSGREFKTWLQGLGLGFSNSQAERAARINLKGQGDPAKAASSAEDLLRAMVA